MSIWDHRYATEDYIFGTEPNVFFKSVIDKLKPGKILVPGAGEGRDAVYAAKLGWEVHAFDLSKVGMEKALRLAASAQTDITYEIMDVTDLSVRKHQYDLIGMTFLHLPTEVRKTFYSTLHKLLYPRGHVLIEAFHPDQIHHSSGGPKDVSMLLTTEMLSEELKSISPIETYNIKYLLDEGPQHQGEAAITRFLGVRL